MEQGLLHLHNLLRWVIVILLVVNILKAFMGMTGKRPFTAGDKRTGLFLMIAAHIQLLLGLYQWITGPYGLKTIQNMGMGEVMKDSAARFWAIEHITGMLIGIILITIGRGVGKKAIPDNIKHRNTFWYFLIALIIIFVTVPWPFRDGIARPLFPGMTP
jgi:hypothetical protein